MSCAIAGDNEYNANGELTNVDDTPDKSFYGPKIPRSKKALKNDGEVKDTNFLAWLDTMMQLNENSDEEWMWDGKGWLSDFDEFYSYIPDNRPEDSITNGVISSIVCRERRRFGSKDEMMDEFQTPSSSDT